jgi:hypothetical protein
MLFEERGEYARAVEAYRRAIDSKHSEWAPKAAFDLLTISKPSHSGMIGDERKMQEAKMAEHGLEEKPMPTIWRVPDQLWEKIEPILTEHDPPKSTGRPRIDQREALDRASSSE